MLLGEIRNIDGFTQMVFGRCDMEANHLTSKVDVKEKRNQKIRELRSQGYTYRQIAETLGVGVATVNTVLREMNNDNM